MTPLKTHRFSGLFSGLASRLIAAGALLAIVAGAQAQGAYPNKPIKMIIPLAAGSAVDNAARVLMQKMSQGLGQSVVIENIAGSAGLPLVLVDGVTVATGRYPSRAELARWAGLGRRYPVAGAAFSLFLLALAGIPLSSGFIGKFSCNS